MDNLWFSTSGLFLKGDVEKRVWNVERDVEKEKGGFPRKGRVKKEEKEAPRTKGAFFGFRALRSASDPRVFDDVLHDLFEAGIGVDLFFHL